MTEQAQTEAQAPSTSPRQLIDEGKRDFALKQYSQAADKFADALEALRETHGEASPLLAPVLHRYGRALLEHAILTSGALGDGGGPEALMPSRSGAKGTEKTVAAANAAADENKGAGEVGKAIEREASNIAKEIEGEASKASGSTSKPSHSSLKATTQDPRFSFSGDAESDDEEEEGGEEEEEEGDKEDDMSVAFSVLDFARVLYEKSLEAADGPRLECLDGSVLGELEIKAELAEVLNDLGDVGLESENFSQASSDYEASLTMLSPLLQAHSRRLADAHLRLGLALEFHPDMALRAKAERHVRAAIECLRVRQAALDARSKALASGEAAESSEKSGAGAVQASEESAKGKGKGKARADEDTKIEKDDIAEMSAEKVAAESKDVQEMTAELDAKLDEYKTAPPGSNLEAADRTTIEQAIGDAFLGASTNAPFANAGSSSAASAPVNDLSSMVKKKRKDAGANGSTQNSSEAQKRKADEGAQAELDAKKQRAS